MKLFIEYILDEIEQIGLKNDYRVSLSSTKNEDNYLRGILQYFDDYFDIHFVIFFTFPEENPNLNYIFWILDRHGNKQLVKEDDSKESEDKEKDSKESEDKDSDSKEDIMAKVKKLALKEIKINLTEGADIRYLLEEIGNIVKAQEGNHPHTHQ
ncbi:hypothetical protein ACFOU2_08655 [Bacillus songklensis]|uniref:Uncharacterized protein n=1 Tax=Bacillus songklensis TaxID=1069116 RepID=A0ABV8B2U1_9BACI